MNDNDKPKAEVFDTDAECLTSCTEGRKPYVASLRGHECFIAAKDLNAAKVAYMERHSLSFRQMTLGEVNTALRAALIAKQ